MAIKQTKHDDLTDEVLPDSTKPIQLSLGRTRYNLYLSEDSHGKLLDALNPFITGADKVADTPKEEPAAEESTETAAPKVSVPRGIPSKFAEAKKEQTDVFKVWAKDENIELPEVGAAAQEHYDSFFKAHPDLPRIIGRRGLKVDEWYTEHYTEDTEETEDSED